MTNHRPAAPARAANLDVCEVCGGKMHIINVRNSKVAGFVARRRRRACGCGNRKTTFEVTQAGIESLLSDRQDLRRAREIILGERAQLK